MDRHELTERALPFLLRRLHDAGISATSHTDEHTGSTHLEIDGWRRINVENLIDELAQTDPSKHEVRIERWVAFIMESGRIAEQSVTDPDELRTMLDFLLTARPPAPLPEDIAADLDTLLEAEAAERGMVDATEIPPLAITDHVPGLLGRNVAFWRGDLTRLRAGAVLNAANSGMLGCFAPGHRCIDNIIHAVAGPALRAECARYMTWAETFDPTRRQGGEPAGRAVFTGGYHLPAQHVIHSVGPVIEDGRKPTLRDRRLLSSCYTSVLNVAHAAGLGSVGLCSLSTGVFGYPKRQAALVTLETIGRWLAAHPDSRMRIVISLNADVDVAAYEAALAPPPWRP